jgi:hypothetical protein
MRFPGLANRSELQQQQQQRREEISRSYKSIGIAAAAAAAAAGEQALCSGLGEQQQWKRILGITRRYPTVKM